MSKNFKQLIVILCTNVELNDKGKGKGHPRTGHEGPEGVLRYSTALSLTSAIGGVGG